MAVQDYISEHAKSLMMGPSSLRIARELCHRLELPARPRILDLGCGRALSTLYLATLFPDATIFAADLWIEPSENLATFRAAGVADRVIPLKAEACELPFAADYFDAVVSIDSWHYYAAEPGYLDNHVAPLVSPGGKLLVAVPGWKAGHDGSVPDKLEPWVKDEYNFRTGEWWRELWNDSGLVSGIEVRDLACNAEAWADWLTCDNEHARQDVSMLEAEAGRWFATVALTARRK